MQINIVANPKKELYSEGKIVMVIYLNSYNKFFSSIDLAIM